MGFFDSLSDLVLGSNSNAKDLTGQMGINLGNIFLPGGIHGGASNEQVPGGYGGSPLNEADYNWASQNWQKFRGIQDHDATGEYAWWGDPEQTAGLSAEGKKYLETALKSGGIGGAANFGDINWGPIAAKFGGPAYASTEGAAGGAGGAGGAAGDSALGDLEPARGMFAGIAAGMPVGGNTQGNILELLRKQAQPWEQKQFQGINQNLFSRGRLGGDDSMTGEAYRNFSRGLAEADTQRQIASYGLADQLATSQLGRQLSAAQGAAGLTQLSTLPFDMALKLAMAKSSAAGAQARNLNESQGDSLVDAWSKFWSFG